MSISTRTLAGREQGQFPISKGTSLAIESLANLVPDRPHVKPEPVSQIDVLLVNVRTIYRNMLSAIKAAVKDSVLAEDVPDYLFQEMKQIRDAVSKISNGKVDTYFYLCTYPDLKKHFPDAKLVVQTTAKQQRDKAMEDQVMGAIAQSPQNYGDPRIFEYYLETGKLENERVGILTHLPLDLVNRQLFKEIYLLESNTGAFKGARDFSSKFKVKPEGAQFPFTAFTLQLLGDNKMFMPQMSEVIGHVATVAKQSRWTFMTTPEKIKYNLQNAEHAGKYSSLLRQLMRP